MALFSEVLAAGVTIRESANDGSDFTNPAADYRRLFLGEDGLLHVKDSSGTVSDPWTGGGGGGIDAGTSFPGSPATDDLFDRTDRDIIYRYDGTRWVSIDERCQTLAVLDNNLPHTATDSRLYGAVDLGANGIWVTRMVVVTLGISIDGSNYWTYQLNKRDATSTETAVGGSFSTNADTTSQWVRHDVTIGAAVTTGLTWALKATKVSSPTSTYEAAQVYYRLIG